MAVLYREEEEEAAITKRDTKVEKLNDTKSLNDSKMDNAVGYSKKNAIVNNNIDTEKLVGLCFSVIIFRDFVYIGFL